MLVIFGLRIFFKNALIKLMERKACKELLNIETISLAFKSDSKERSDQIFSCLYSCYQPVFIKWATITYRYHPSGMIEFMANNSFTDGVLRFTETASRGELYKGNASVKTVLLQYCRYILLGYIKSEERLAEKKKRLAYLLSDNDANEAADHIHKSRYKNVMLALQKMTADDRQIIQWKHFEGKSNDEIANILAITVPSFTNRLYRCMQRLRKLVEEIEKKNR